MLFWRYSAPQLTCFRSSLLRAISTALSPLLIADRLFAAVLVPELPSSPPAPDHPPSSVSQSFEVDVLIGGVPILDDGADEDGMDGAVECNLVIVRSGRGPAREASAGGDFRVLKLGVRAGAGVGTGEGVAAGVSSKVSPQVTSIVGSGKKCYEDRVSGVQRPNVRGGALSKAAEM